MCRAVSSGQTGTHRKLTPLLSAPVAPSSCKRWQRCAAHRSGCPPLRQRPEPAVACLATCTRTTAARRPRSAMSTAPRQIVLCNNYRDRRARIGTSLPRRCTSPLRRAGDVAPVGRMQPRDSCRAGDPFHGSGHPRRAAAMPRTDLSRRGWADGCMARMMLKSNRERPTSDTALLLL
jgi:hypothetical protein